MSSRDSDSVTITIPKGRMVGFPRSIPLGFKNYFAFGGRSSRGAYWYWTLFVFIAAIIAAILDVLLFPEMTQSAAALSPISTVFSLATFIPGLTVSIRRLHDIGRSGWWFLIAFTIIGVILLIYWSCKPGQRVANRFGADIEAGRE